MFVRRLLIAELQRIYLLVYVRTRDGFASPCFDTIFSDRQKWSFDMFERRLQSAGISCLFHRMNFDGLLWSGRL